MKKVLLFIFFALGIAWVFIMASILPRRILPENSQWQLPIGENGILRTNGINDVQYSPDGTHLAVASAIGIWLYNLNTDAEPVPLTTDRVNVYNVSFSPDGKMLAGGHGEELVQIWDVNTRVCKKTFIAEHGRNLRVLFSTNGKTLASSGHHEINLWDIATSTHKEISEAYVHFANRMFIKGDSGTLASVDSGDTIRLLDIVTREEKKAFKGHTKNVKSVAFSPDGQTLASGSWDRTVRLWDVATGKQKKVLKGHQKSINSIAFSTDGQMLATASRDETVRLWDTTTGKHKKTLKGHTAEVNGAAFSPDRQTIVSWSNDRTIRLWDVDTGKFKKALQYPKSSKSQQIP